MTEESTIICTRCQREFLGFSELLPSHHAEENRLRRSDYAPSQVEISETLDMLQEEERWAKRYDDEITGLSRVMEKLKAERKMLEERINLRRSITSCIRRVPVEIWQEVFMFACLSQEYSFDTSRFIPTSKTATENRLCCRTYDISLVCWQWRNVATSLGCLWTSLSVDLYGLDHDVRPILQTYIRNRRDHPLRMRLSRLFEFRRSTKNNFKENAILAYNYLLRNIPKCSELAISCGSSAAMIPSDAIPQSDSLHLLRTLTISLDMEANYALPAYFRAALQKAPLLTNLKISGRLSGNPSTFPYHQLTNLDISADCNIDWLIAVIPSCSVLQTLVLPALLDDHGPDRAWDSHYRIPIPSLTTLYVRMYEYPIYICPIFSAFRFPSLINLSMHLSGDFVSEDGWSPPLMDGLRDSCKNLEKLDLSLAQMNARTEEAFPVSDILTTMPNLTSLKFKFDDDVPVDTEVHPTTVTNSPSCHLLRALAVGTTATEDMFSHGGLNEEVWRTHLKQNPSTLLPGLTALYLYEDTLPRTIGCSSLAIWWALSRCLTPEYYDCLDYEIATPQKFELIYGHTPKTSLQNACGCDIDTEDFESAGFEGLLRSSFARLPADMEFCVSYQFCDEHLDLFAGLMMSAAALHAIIV